MNRFIFALMLLITSTAWMPANAQDTSSGGEIEKIPYEFIVEAEQFLDRCLIDPKYTQFYNCDCLAANYLDERLKDPFEQAGVITMNIQGRCIDPSLATGEAYLSCLNNGTIFPDITDPEAYCECYAREFGIIFEQAGRSPNTRVLTAVKSRAHSNCRGT